MSCLLGLLSPGNNSTIMNYSDISPISAFTDKLNMLVDIPNHIKLVFDMLNWLVIL